MVLKSRLTPPDWSADGDPEKEALCRKFALPTKNDPDADTDPFFYDMEEAVHVCNGTYSGVVCPFRRSCLVNSLVNNEGNGAWGGLLPVQRKWVRRQRHHEDPEQRITMAQWEYPEEWLHRVPPPEFFEEEEDAKEDA